MEMECFCYKVGLESVVNGYLVVFNYVFWVVCSNVIMGGMKV